MAARVTAVSDGGRSTTTRRPRRTPGKVEKAARAVLAEIDTDHAAADLLAAVAERLAQDIDGAADVRDRVAASKELREVLADLDTAVIPPKGPGLPVAPGVSGDADDPFEIGALPPGLEHPPAS